MLLGKRRERLRSKPEQEELLAKQEPVINEILKQWLIKTSKLQLGTILKDESLNCAY
jgi:hypothetical protein